MVTTANTSCADTFKDYLEHTGSAIVLAQELRVAGQDEADLQSWAAGKGWLSHTAPAVRLPSGRLSGGVGIFVRKHLGLLRPQGVQCTQLEEARLVVGYTPGVVAGGLTIICSYLRDGEELSADNMASVWRVAELLGGTKGAWLWGGDFNMSPETFNEAGLVHRLGGSGGGALRGDLPHEDARHHD